MRRVYARAPAEFRARFWEADGRARHGLLRREQATQLIEALPTPARVVALEGELARECKVSPRTMRDYFMELRSDRPRLVFYLKTNTGERRETTPDDLQDERHRDRERVWSRASFERQIVRARDGSLDAYTGDPR